MFIILPWRSLTARQIVHMVELAELAQVKGFDSRTIEKLRAFVSILPVSRTPVNVNFAPAEVLVGLIEDLTLSDARLIVQQRQGQPYKDIADFKQTLAAWRDKRLWMAIFL